MEVERVGEDDTSEKADGKGKKYTREVGSLFGEGRERLTVLLHPLTR